MGGVSGWSPPCPWEWGVPQGAAEILGLRRHAGGRSWMDSGLRSRERRQVRSGGVAKEHSGGTGAAPPRFLALIPGARGGVRSRPAVSRQSRREGPSRSREG